MDNNNQEDDTLLSDAVAFLNSGKLPYDDPINETPVQAPTASEEEHDLPDLDDTSDDEDDDHDLPDLADDDTDDEDEAIFKARYPTDDSHYEQVMTATIAAALTGTSDMFGKELQGQPEILPTNAQMNFSNKSMCFFKVCLGNPSKTELTKILRYQQKTGQLPTGQQTLLLLTEDDIDPSHLQPTDNDIQTLMLPDIPISEKELKDTGPFQVVTKAFADGGSACSVISKDLAMALRLLPLRAAQPMTMVDINKGKVKHDLVAYVQLEFPGEAYRQIIPCLILDTTPHPFLIGSADQAQLRRTRAINEDSQTRTKGHANSTNPIHEPGRLRVS